ncbi:hypothetical protein BCR37DRAFT_375730 [Protomyces lactucae-debilis]|uniref:Uncharacterized protein n=1 Tax=Protomyces lactucae-debilis TaxID=2754530 RepID=A0A1Y2FWZ5_PROLT|nr:uncharacterized protein BCR37DRAFT_375730 [Protomyces lactucae-debilis]ORY87824.1 hypothetical protein BCR37DRAFT_375730 [Protomyces lactucae-debilis]
MSKKRKPEQQDCLVALKKIRRCSSSRQSRLSLLDLPAEILLDIFCYSTNPALAETCTLLSSLLCALPIPNARQEMPPLWLQKRFIAHLNPYFPFALEKALRRRFCTSITIVACHDLMTDGQWQELTIPLRLCVPPFDLRKRLLYTELFIQGVRIRSSSLNKALVIWAGHDGSTTEGPFWAQFQITAFDHDVLLAACKASARKRLFARERSFDFLVRHASFSSSLGQELMSWAVKHRDMATVAALQQHGVIPDVKTLNRLYG